MTTQTDDCTHVVSASEMSALASEQRNRERSDKDLVKKLEDARIATWAARYGVHIAKFIAPEILSEVELAAMAGHTNYSRLIIVSRTFDDGVVCRIIGSYIDTFEKLGFQVCCNWVLGDDDHLALTLFW